MRPTTPIADAYVEGAGYEDLRFPVTGINPPGAATDPTRSASSGLYYFSGTADNVIAAVVQMPHAWAEGTPIRPHLHLIFPTSAAANTRWKLEWTMANLGGNYDGAIPTSAAGAMTYAHSDTITVANPQDITANAFANFAAIDMTGYIRSSTILMRISRLVNSDGADTDTNACVLAEFDIHYVADKFGKT